MVEGIWCGRSRRTEETSVVTHYRVIKCRTVKRLPADKRWDATLIHDMEGTTWQPVPGHKIDYVPVEVGNHGAPSERAGDSGI